MASTPWQVVAFENHTPEPVSLSEVTTDGEERVLASLNAGEASYYFSRMGAVWRARSSEGEVLTEHRVGPHFLTDDGSARRSPASGVSSAREYPPSERRLYHTPSTRRLLDGV